MIQNISSNVTIVQKKQLWQFLLQTGSEITEKEQLLCNTHNVTIVMI